MQNTQTPKEAAHQFASKQINNFSLETLHEYKSVSGEILHWVIRGIDQTTQEKWMRPMYLHNDKFVLGKPHYPNGTPLYALEQLHTSPDQVVMVFEGEKCVDHAIKLGILATTSGSATSAQKADWSPVKNRNVRLWPDNDKAGMIYICFVAELLSDLGCTVKIVDIEKLHLPDKGDIVDWFEANPNATIDDIMNLPVLDYTEPAIKAESSLDPDENSKESQASMLVAYVNSEAKLFHDQNGDVYAQYNNTHETQKLNGRQFKDWLVASFYKRTGKSPREQSIREAISTLSGLARIHGECHDVNIRVAMFEESYFLDLAEAGLSRAVKISAGKWEIIENPPVCFLRPEAMQPLPEPISGGNIAKLTEMINIPENTSLLVIAWLAETLRPDTPFPVLELIGEQGSAKSTTQTVLRQLIDPNACNLRGAPKTPEDVYVSAGMNWMISYENISNLSPAMQDSFCTIATGGGYAKRKLYSDSDESVIKAKRPIIINGISVAITRQDLVERTISIETPVILDRKEVPELYRQYESSRAEILGALLDIIAKALEILPSVELAREERPRLLEFCKFGMAIAEAMGEDKDSFLGQFNEARQEGINRTIDASPVASALIEWFDKSERKISVRMPLKDLLKAVEPYKPNNTNAWPISAKGFGDALRRAAPALREMGIICRSLGRRGSYIDWEVTPRR